MTSRGVIGTCVLGLSRTGRLQQLCALPLSSRNVGFLGWAQNPGAKSRGSAGGLFSNRRGACEVHLSAAVFFSSTPDSGRHKSRLRNTLDSVTKAVGGTHADILSKVSRLKPAATAPATPVTEADRPGTDAAPQEGKPPSGTPAQADGMPRSAPATPGRGASTAETDGEQTPGLFHPSKLSANLDQTYSYLARHINAYFSTSTDASGDQPDPNDGKTKASPRQPDKSGPNGGEPRSDQPPSQATPSPPAPPPAALASPKKGIGHYLSYPAPSVQAFVGSYITPLVPKFRADSKSVAAAKEEPPSAKPGEGGETREQGVAEDAAKRLLLQREKIIARVSVDNRTRALVQALLRASGLKLQTSRVEDLSYHLIEFPETRGVAVKEKIIPCLLRLRQNSDPALQAVVREALALVGYTDPVKGRGIRVLSIDGGGTRGLVALQTLQKLEDLTGKPVHQLFDYICGVSTGAILAFMLGVYQIPLVECEELYRRLGSDVFKQNVIVGTVKMGWSHAFYDCQVWEAILKERMGSDLMVETSRNPRCPKVAAVSTIVNRGTPLKAYVFRNYNLLPGVCSHYLGGCQHQLWQAIRASSAAPGYFQEFVLGNDLHQDGGLLVNNPTALAVHECYCLWPGARLQAVVSLGTGRFSSAGTDGATHTSLRTKLTNVISSATDTEEVHTMLDALLPPDTYFRFNPYMSQEVPLDESRSEKLGVLQAEGLRYLQRNEEKLKKAARVLVRDKSPSQMLTEWVKLKGDMYHGLPIWSRL